MFDIRCPLCGYDLGEPHGIGACEHRLCLQCTARILLQSGRTRGACLCPICHVSLRQLFVVEHVDLSYGALQKKVSSGEEFWILPGYPVTVFRPFDLQNLCWFFQLVCFECDLFFEDNAEFLTHFIAVHKKYICKKCLGNRTCFSWELGYYSRNELKEHLRTVHNMNALALAPGDTFRGITPFMQHQRRLT